MSVVDKHVRQLIQHHMRLIGQELTADVLVIYSPILFGLDFEVKENVEGVGPAERERLAIVLDTMGGVIDIVERMVNTVRQFYREVDFIIPDRAMSAGTVFALSANNIYMNYYSYLGPIDPQVEKDGKLTPALAYLKQFERLQKKAGEGQLTQVDALMLSQLDLADLYQYEQAREHSVELLEKWLSCYKFKNWSETETSNKPVTNEMKRARAKEIAKTLNETERWHSHGRGISMRTLRDEVGLRIADFDEKGRLSSAVRSLSELVVDYTTKSGISAYVEIISRGATNGGQTTG